MKKRLCVIGVGLIGGSLALAARRSGLYDLITGFDTDSENLVQAQNIAVIDRACSSIASAVKSANLVVIATPVGSTQKVLTDLLPIWDNNCVYTDVGSTKQSVIFDLVTVFGQIPENFVAGHPIAGTEQSGASAAFAELFDNKRVILTPSETTRTQALTTVREFWEKAAHAIVSEMQAELHDQILAATSHLPHLVAYALVNLLTQHDQKKTCFRYAASGFKDFTRIASSDARMWADICVANRDQLGPLLENYQNELGNLLHMLKTGNKEQLYEHFRLAQNTRREWIS